MNAVTFCQRVAKGSMGTDLGDCPHASKRCAIPVLEGNGPRSHPLRHALRKPKDPTRAPFAVVRHCKPVERLAMSSPTV